MKYDAVVIEQWIVDIQAVDYKLTKWELDFVESIADQMERRGGISERQEEILERIYAEKTS